MSDTEMTAPDANRPQQTGADKPPTSNLATLALALALGAGAGGVTGFLAGSGGAPQTEIAQGEGSDGPLAALAQRARAVAVDAEAQADRRAFAFNQLALYDPTAASEAALDLVTDPAAPDALRFAALRAYETPQGGDDAAMSAAVLDGLAAQTDGVTEASLAAHRAFFAGRDDDDLAAVTAWFANREPDDGFARAADAALAMADGAFLPVMAGWAGSDDVARSELAWSRLGALDQEAGFGEAGRREALGELIAALEPLIARGPQPVERDIAGVAESYAREIYDAILTRDVATLSRLRLRAGDYANPQLTVLFDYIFAGGQPTAFELEQLGYELPSFEALETFLVGGYGVAGAGAAPDPYRPYREAVAAMMRAEPSDWSDAIAPALRALPDSANGREAASLVVAAWLSRLGDAPDPVLVEGTLAYAGENPEAFSEEAAFLRLSSMMSERAALEPEGAFAQAAVFYRAALAADQTDAFDAFIGTAIAAALAELAEDPAASGLEPLREAAIGAAMTDAQRAGFNRALAIAGLNAFAPEAVAYIYEAPSLERAVTNIVAQAREGTVEARRVAAIDLLRALVEGAAGAGAAFSTPLEAAALAAFEPRAIELGADAGEGPSARERDRADDLRAAAAREFDWPSRFRDASFDLAAGSEAAFADLTDDNGSYWLHVLGEPNVIAGLDVDGQISAALVVSEDGEILSGETLDPSEDETATVLAPTDSQGLGAYFRVTPRTLSDGAMVRHASSPVLDLAAALRRLDALEVEPGVVYALDTAASEVERGWVRLTASEDATFVVRTFDLDDQADTTLEAFVAESATSLQRNDDGGEGLASQLTLSANAGDSFDIAIGHFARNLGAFRFTIDQLPPTVRLQNAVDRNAAITLSLDEEHAMDSVGIEGGWIRFRAPQDASYVIETYNLVEVDTTLNAFLGETDIGYDDDGAAESLASRLEIQGEAGQVYDVRVAHFAGNTSGGQFTLRIRQLAPATDFSDISNRARPLLLAIGAREALNVDAGSRSGWVSFTAPEAGRYEVVTSDLAGGVDTTLTAYRGDQSVETGYNDDYDGSLASRLVIDADAGETYVLRVDDIGWAGEGRLEILVQPLP